MGEFYGILGVSSDACAEQKNIKSIVCGHSELFLYPNQAQAWFEQLNDPLKIEIECFV